MSTHESTPLMQQYHEIKAQYADALLLFQVGDFYELFYDDAKQAAAFLSIALTVRGKTKGEPIPLCGVPVHALEHYLHKLVKGGFTVALCDQLEDPRPGALVKRGVTNVFTPGTLTDSKLLDERSASYLFSFYPTQDSWGLLFGELLTAQLFVTTITAHNQKLLESELIRFFPDEILLPDTQSARELQTYFKRLGYFTTVVHAVDHAQQELAEQWVHKQFASNVRDTIAHNESVRLALYYFYAYMRKNQEASLTQFNTLFFYKPEDFLILDSATARNLELIKNAHDGTCSNTLFEIMDYAKTAMGSRMIKKWIQRPLVKKEAIIQRQEVVTFFLSEIIVMSELEKILSSIGDIERVVGRIALKRAQVTDYTVLAKVLALIPHVQTVLSDKRRYTLLCIIAEHMNDFSALSQLLSSALYEFPHEQWIVKEGFDQHLDLLRGLVHNSNKKVMELEQHEQQETGINSLKIRYNTIQGYYIEITKSHLDAVPERYQRLQTLVGRERFTITQLQQLQHEIEQAHKNIISYEQRLFETIQSTVEVHIGALRRLAHALAHLDALVSLARLAYNNRYVCPTLNEFNAITIKDGRHPVVEKASLIRFIPNDTYLTDEQSLWIITGPNMGGKSTYLRQVALICVMAHIGSFVPAHSADIALLDRIFTRLGAYDNVAQGKSTFLVEMEETATICSYATKNSLVVLDEVGRGTSTFDGLAIAQAVVEYIFHTIGARCLFATHYHELTQLSEKYAGIAAYHVASKKGVTGILFLYKIVKGVADGSFGIEVALLAQLPPCVIDRAKELVSEFNSSSFVPVTALHEHDKNLKQRALLLQTENIILKQEQINVQHLIKMISSIDFDTLSAKKAFDILWDMKENM